MNKNGRSGINSSSISKADKKICSFDIFDTILIRKCGASSIVFDILADRILGNSAEPEKKHAFALERCRALHRAESANTDNGDPKLSDIYSHADFSAFTAMSKSEIMEEEMNVESDMLVGVESLRRFVESKRNAGYQICFTSDMYLPSDFLQSILLREGFFKEGDLIFVSCEDRGSKRNGSLFGRLRDLSDKRVEHYGDNRFSDGKMLKRSINGQFHKVNHKFTPYQKFIASQFDFNQSQRPLALASISKAALLSAKNPTAAVQFATDIVAPVLVPVVYEIMKRAYNEGKRRIFFLARDAKIMFNIAKVLSPLFPGLRLEYLYVSRTSFYVPSLKEISKESCHFIYSPMKNLGASPMKFVRKYMPGLRLDENLHFNSIEELCANEDVISRIRAYHSDQRNLLIGYLRSVGYASDSDEIAGVDMFGSGKTFEYLNNFLAQYGYKPVTGYLYNLSHQATTANQGDIRSVSDLDRLYGHYDRIGGLIYIFEDYIGATDDGRTTHYKMDEEGRVIPVFQEESPRMHQEHSRLYNLHREICNRYAESFMQCGLYQHNDYNIAAGQWLLSKFGRNPLKAYVEPLTESVYDKSGLQEETIVKKLKPKDLIGLIKSKGNYGSWARGSVVATFGNLGRFAIWSLGKLKHWYINR